MRRLAPQEQQHPQRRTDLTFMGLIVQQHKAKRWKVEILKCRTPWFKTNDTQLGRKTSKKSGSGVDMMSVMQRLDEQPAERAHRKAISAHACDADIFKRQKRHKILNFSSTAGFLYVSDHWIIQSWKGRLAHIHKVEQERTSVKKTQIFLWT